MVHIFLFISDFFKSEYNFYIYSQTGFKSPLLSRVNFSSMECKNRSSSCYSKAQLLHCVGGESKDKNHEYPFNWIGGDSSPDFVLIL